MNPVRNIIPKVKTIIKEFLGLNYPYVYVQRRLSSFAKVVSPISNKEVYNKEVDIIMPIYNRLAETKMAIEYLFKNANIKFKLILVDNNSDNKTQEYLKNLSHKNIKVIFLKENLGASIARESGLKESQNEFVAFVDNDILIMPNYFENLLTTIQTDNKIAGVQSKVVLPNLKIQINTPTFMIKDQDIVFTDKDIDKKFDDKSTFESKTCNYIPIGATLWRREVFNRFSFDEGMNTAFEDNDFAYSVYKGGYIFRNCPKAIALHINSEFSPKTIQDNSYMAGRYSNDKLLKSLKIFYKKHQLIFYFKTKEGFAKYLGFSNPEEYENSLKA
ncbi:MAG: glycosyltransferase [Candidatus Dojkabacteria bacterium]